ncbi:hypothetical protein PAMP_010867 [Pampus punctatissimus]
MEGKTTGSRVHLDDSPNVNPGPSGDHEHASSVKTHILIKDDFSTQSKDRRKLEENRDQSAGCVCSIVLHADQ